jgi:hypothetical protein
MAGTPETIVLDPAKPALERAEATEMRAKMLQESVGSVGKNIMDMVTQYQDLKAQKQKQDLASITMAGTLSGGMDNLPQDTKNKLPGILGVPLPTDDQGNVKITPDLDTVIKRGTIKLLGDDPNAMGVLAGVRDKEADPFKMANDVKIQGMRDATAQARIAADQAKTAADNETKIHNTILTGEYGLSKQELANAGGDAKQALANRGKLDAVALRNAAKGEDLPSPFALDPKTNTLMDEPQWYATYPNTVMPTKLSNRDAKTIATQQKGAAAITASNSTVEANKARLAAANFKLDTLIANKGRDAASSQMKMIVDSYKLAKGTSNEANMTAWANKEIPNILSQSGFSDDDLKSLGTMSGQGGWVNWAANKFSSAMGVTNPGSDPSLTQPLTATIPGVSPVVAGVVAGVVGNALKPPSAGGAPAPSGTMSVDEFKKRYPMPQ